MAVSELYGLCSIDYQGWSDLVPQYDAVLYTLPLDPPSRSGFVSVEWEFDRECKMLM